uniref:Fibrinogen C-terminal domain-containing protein n=1 Tax=Stomoxys calcitrans TaxID=35570 RepID=A0A1I8PBX2_STOCA
MRFLWLFAIWHVTKATDNNILMKDYLDPNDVVDHSILWKHLFIKLNTVLSKTEALEQEFADIIKRQNDIETRLSELSLNLDKNFKNNEKENLNAVQNQEAILSQWTTIMRRQDGTVQFNRKWEEYKNGFGNPDGDFFIGLDMLHALTNVSRSQELLVVLTDFDGETRYARYSAFRIGNEDERYAINELGTYSGDAGDGMGWHRGKKFSTLDRDNNSGNKRDCPDTFKGGWWFHDPCYSGHLHGPYRQKSEAKTWGVSWHPWRGWNYSVKYAAMMIRPKM